MAIIEQKNSPFVINLLNEARLEISPKKISLYETEKLPPGVDAQISEEETGDFCIYVKNGCLSEYTISHEILHIL